MNDRTPYGRPRSGGDELAKCRERDKRCRNLLESTGHGYARCEILLDERGVAADFRFLEVNASFGTVTGLAPKRVIGRRMGELQLCLEQRWMEALVKVATTGEPVRFEACSEGMHRCCEVFASRLAPGQLDLLLVDIAGRKRAKESVDEREERRVQELDVIYRSAPIGLCVLDTDLSYLRINDYLADFNGFPAEAHLGKRVRDMAPFVAEEAERITRVIIETGEPQLNVEGRRATPGHPGEERFTNEHWLPLKDKRGKVWGINVVVEDVTERKRAEQALREREAQVRLITDRVPVLVGYIDEQQHYRFNNRLYTEWFGVAPETLQGRTVREIIGPAAYSKVEPYLRRALKGESVRFDFKGQYGSGPPREVDVAYVPDVDAQGAVRGVCTLVQDVGEIQQHKRIEAELQRSNTLLERMFDSVHFLLAHLDAEFNFLRVNRAYAAVEGRDAEYFVGKNHFALYPNAENEEIFRRVVDSGVPFSVAERAFEYPLHPEWGVTYWDWSLHPTRDENGRVDGLVLILVDVTERAKARRQLETVIVDMRRRATLMVRAEELAQLGYGEDDRRTGKVTWSDGIFRLLGIESDTDAFSYDDFKHYVHEEDWPLLRSAFANTVEGRVPYQEVEFRIRRGGDGEEHVLRGQAEVERDDKAKPSYLFWVMQDVTVRRGLEAILRERFRLMADVLEDAVWISAPFMTEIAYVNAAYEKIWGCPRRHLYSRPAFFFEAIHPEDRERLREHAGWLMSGEWEFRIRRPDQTERWIHLRVLPLLDTYGKAELTFGIARDVTERKRAEEALYRREQEFEALAEGAPDVIARVDKELRLRYINPAIEPVTGHPREWFLGKVPGELDLSSDEVKAREEMLREVFAHGHGKERNYQITTPHGERYFQARLVPEIGRGGEVDSVLEVDRDITELKLAEAALENMALRDPLTGVANRRYLAQLIDREIRREARHQLSMALIMVDIDWFKRYNDFYGHLRGDQCLREIAQILETHLHRPTDILIRYGGEEFLIVLLETDGAAAFRLAERICRSVFEHHLPHEASPLSSVVTVSLGVAAGAAHLNPFDELLTRADEALYRAKAHGRNRVESYLENQAE